MNEGLKFRIWNKAGKCMIPSTHFAIRWDGTLMQLSSRPDVWHENQSDSVVLRSVGLTDKNWADIYEGDVVRTGQWESATFEIDRFGVAWFQKNWSALQFVDVIELATNSEISSDWKIRSVEVIWNIYQNPELLK